jgi:hypothetical protein
MVGKMLIAEDEITELVVVRYGLMKAMATSN